MNLNQASSFLYQQRKNIPMIIIPGQVCLPENNQTVILLIQTSLAQQYATTFKTINSLTSMNNCCINNSEWTCRWKEIYWKYQMIEVSKTGSIMLKFWLRLSKIMINVLKSYFNVLLLNYLNISNMKMIWQTLR